MQQCFLGGSEAADKYCKAFEMPSCFLCVCVCVYGTLGNVTRWTTYSRNTDVSALIVLDIGKNYVMRIPDT